MIHSFIHSLIEGGWWYNKCSISNLNGQYLRGPTKKKSGIFWQSWKGQYYSLKAVVVKIKTYGKRWSTASREPRDCSDLPEYCLESDFLSSGVYTVKIGRAFVEVYCDMEKGGEFWTVCVRLHLTTHRTVGLTSDVSPWPWPGP